MTSATLQPPHVRVGPIAWLRVNLFSTWYNAILSLLIGALLAWVILQFSGWALGAARWDVITRNMRLFLIGQFPGDQAWRIWLNLAVISGLAGLSGGSAGGAVRTLATSVAAAQLLFAGLIAVSGIGLLGSVAYLANAALVWVGLVAGMRRLVPQRVVTIGWLVSLPASFILVAGVGDTAIPSVSTNLWSGLLLTFLLATVGIVLSFPFGVVLALGRRSALPAVRWLSTAYIELIRGVPLVTILFMADIMLPLFLPGELRIDRVARAMGGITLFSAAYVAENVRGGLQAIPTGQVEAAHALGLNGFLTNRFIVLPQALRAVIPANVGLFISLLKDTTLVTIVGLLELLGIGRSVLAQSESLGAQMEVYVFVAALFFVMSFAMSQASYRLEASLGVGER